MTKWNVPDQKERRPVHPEGTFDAVVVGAKADKTKTEKNMLVLELKTGHGTLKTWMTHNEGSEYEWIFFRELEALGVTREFFDKDPSYDDVALECLKARVMITVEHEDYKGHPTAKVQRIEPAPTSQLPAPQGHPGETPGSVAKAPEGGPPAEDEPF